MGNFSFKSLIEQQDHWLLVRGLIYLFVLSLPIIGFVSIMGGAAPNSPGFFYTFGLVVLMMTKEVLIFLVLFKMIDSILTLKLALRTFSFLSTIIGSAIYTIYFNIVYDNMFQIKQGNYGTIAAECIAPIVFWIVVVQMGKIRLFKKKS